MGELNGDAKVIVERIDNFRKEYDSTTKTLFEKIDKLCDRETQQDIKIKGCEDDIKSCQSEVSDHKTNHKSNVVNWISVLAVIIALGTLIIEIIRKG